MVPRTVSSLPVAPTSFVPSPQTPAGPAPAVLIGFPAPPVNRIAPVATCNEKNPPPGGCPKNKCTEQHPCPPPPPIEPTPEPGTIVLFATGLLAAIGIGRWKRQRRAV
ncbi:MAG: PEP-CTERM sorting domain-containing protein [Terriglobia bacterium]